MATALSRFETRRPLIQLAASRNGVGLVVAAAAVAIWVSSLARIHLRAMRDTGLFSVLPPTFWASFALLAFAFLLAVSAPKRSSLLLAGILAAELIFLYGTPAFVEDGARTQVAWKLAGIPDHINRYGSVDGRIDAFFDWPGFFVLQAFLVKIAGLKSTLALAKWAPLAFNLAYLLPLTVLFRLFGLDGRHVWLALWVFLSANWVGQDYLAPQAFGYFFYLAIVATVVAVVAPFVRNLQITRHREVSWARAGALVLTIVAFAAIVPSHQLTPWMTVLSVGSLGITTRREPTIGLGVVMAVLAATWVVFFTGPYLAGHFREVAAPVGSVTTNLHANTAGRFHGSVEHRAVLRLREAFSVAIWLAGAAGIVLMRRAGRRILAPAVLGLGPFLAIGFVRYGGELGLRTFFFSLPAAALGGGAVLAVALQRWKRVGFVLSFAALVACGVAFVITRYGNERQDAFSSQDIASVHYLYAHAKPRAAVFAAYDNVPWRYRHYADFRYGILHGELVEGQNVPGIVAQMRRAHRPDVYLILTRSEEEGGHLFQGWSPDLVPRLRRHVLASPQFRLLFSRPDSAIFQLRSRAEIDARDRDARAFALAELRRAHRLGLYNGPIGSNPDPQATYRSLSSRLWHRKHRRSR